MARRAAPILCALIACGPTAPPPVQSERPVEGGLCDDCAVPELERVKFAPPVSEEYCCSFHVEAEDFGGPWITQRNLHGYSGRGFRVSNTLGTPSTSELRTDLPIGRAGFYSVWARGYEGDGRDRRFQVVVGDEELAPVLDAIDRTGFRWQHAGSVRLEPGFAKLLLRDAGDSFEAADAVFLTTDPALDPGQEDRAFRVQPAEEGRRAMLADYVARAERTRDALVVPTSSAAWQAQATRLRARLAEDLALPPLTATATTGLVTHWARPYEGYSVECVSFDGLPGLEVTGNLYVPDGPGPFPVVVSPVGHYEAGKADPAPAIRGRSLAKLGFLTLVYDPHGLGERAIGGNHHFEHFKLLLTGRSNATVIAAEASRALDVLLHRPDADPSRVAITGESGGGLATLFAAAVDPRFRVSAPVVYVASYGRLLATGAAHDPCSFPPRVAGYTDMGELAALVAPGPQLIANALQDPEFTTEAARTAVAEARPIYELFGVPDRLRFLTMAGGHAYPLAAREAVYGLLGEAFGVEAAAPPVLEPATEAIAGADLRCYPSGKIPTGRATITSIARGYAEAAKAALVPITAMEPVAMRAALREVLRVPAELGAPRVEWRGPVDWEGLEAEAGVVDSAGFGVPVFVRRGAGPGPVFVVLHPGLEYETARSPLLLARDLDLSLAYVSVRGYGETLSNEFAAVTQATLLGETILGLRAADLLRVVAALRAEPGFAGRPVVVLARSREAGHVALAAQALSGAFDALAAGPLHGSAMETFTRTIPQALHVPNLLAHADYGHMLALAAERPLAVRFVDPGFGGYDADFAAEAAGLVADFELTDLPSAFRWLEAAAARDRP